MRWFIWLMILAFGGGAIYLVFQGIGETDVPKLIWGMVCGMIALFWICVEGASREP